MYEGFGVRASCHGFRFRCLRFPSPQLSGAEAHLHELGPNALHCLGRDLGHFTFARIFQRL